jgi:glycine cleavage system H protein
MNIPKELLYTKDHEWVKEDGGQAYLGITDFAQEQLGDIVFVEMPEVDAEVKAGDSVAVIESVKTVSSVFSPISGQVVSVNEELESSPELLNEDPYGNHIAVIAIEDSQELNQLMSADQYEAFCREQE